MCAAALLRFAQGICGEWGWVAHLSKFVAGGGKGVFFSHHCVYNQCIYTLGEYAPFRLGGG